jgi:hypothetical protein
MARERKEEAGQKMTDLRSGEGEKWLWERSLLGRNRVGKMTLVVHANTNKEGIGKHDKGDMTIPSNEASDLIMIKSEVFGCFQVFLNVPSFANSPNDLLERGQRRGEHQVIG